MILRSLPILALVATLAGCSSWFPTAPSYDLPDALAIPDVPIPDGYDAAGDGPVSFRDNGPEDSSAEPGCTPQCWINQCGPDGCGGTCGTCPEGTTCSSDQTQCIPDLFRKVLGEPCGQTQTCRPYVESTYIAGIFYDNPAWPACLDDQCADGKCLRGFCSRPCSIRKDERLNGEGSLLSDGIEDADAPQTDCTGGSTESFPSGFVCVRDAPISGPTLGANGWCLPEGSFAPCGRPSDCPADEGCGFLVLLGGVESRCLPAPAGSGSIGDACGYDAAKGVSETCEAWACTDRGCTEACTTGADCLSPGAACDAGTGACAGSGAACATDEDCSAWICDVAALLPDPEGTYRACQPRVCSGDADCRTPDYYCLLGSTVTQEGKVAVEGRCAPRLAGGVGLGESCNVTPGDGLPDVPCADEAYCLDGRCAAACASDADCASVGGLRCARRDLDADPDRDGTFETVVSGSLCTWLGGSQEACESAADCATGVCTPWVPATGEADGPHEADLACMEPADGTYGPGSRCGAAAWDQACDTRFCLDEEADEGIAGWCTRPCRDEADCPGATPVGPDVVRWACEWRALSTAGTTVLADDPRVSWCVPVPGGSSLAACAPGVPCAAAAEVCRAFVRTGAPVGTEAVSFLCVLPGGAGATGAPCDPSADGRECRSGICARTTTDGSGFCSTLCASGADCAGLAGGAAVCDAHLRVPGADPAGAAAVPECRVRATCMACGDDTDCASGYACVDFSNIAGWPDYRCALDCAASDEACAASDLPSECTEMIPSPRSSAAETTRACIPLACG